MESGRRRIRGFTPIKLERYVKLHVACNPGTDRADFLERLKNAVEAKKRGALCRCGEPIWATASAEVGYSCFKCITGEAWPRDDYEIDEVCS